MKIILPIIFLIIFNYKSFAEGVWFPTNKPNCEIWNPQPQDNESAFWSGECLDGKAHGKGALTWKFKKNGKFIMRLVEGEMKNGRREGKIKITYENGDIYIGELNENGNRHGQGKYIYSNGKVKEGVWEDGKMISQSKPI